MAANLMGYAMKNRPIKAVFGGLYWTRTSDPIDVNDVLSARGSFVREKHELHTSHESP